MLTISLPKQSDPLETSCFFWLLDPDNDAITVLTPPPQELEAELSLGYHRLSEWMQSLSKAEKLCWQEQTNHSHPGCLLLFRSSLQITLLLHPIATHRWLVQTLWQPLTDALTQQQQLATLLPQFQDLNDDKQIRIVVQLLLQHLRYYLGADRITLWRIDAHDELMSVVCNLGHLGTPPTQACRTRYLKPLMKRRVLTFSDIMQQPLLSEFEYLSQDHIASRMDLFVEAQPKLHFILSLDFLRERHFSEIERQLAQSVVKTLQGSLSTLIDPGILQTDIPNPSARKTPELLQLLQEKSGQNYFESLAVLLCGITGAKKALIYECISSGNLSHLQTLAHAGDGNLEPSFCLFDESSLLNSPPGILISHDGATLQTAQELFCPDMLLAGYASVHLHNTQDQDIGLISLLFDRPIDDPMSLDLLLQQSARDASLELQVFREQRELQIAAIAFDSPSPMLIMDKQFKILRGNNAWLGISGFEPWQIYGKHFRILRPDYYGDTFYQQLLQTLKQEKAWKGELQCVYQDGNLHPQFAKLQGIYDPDGQLSYYLCNLSDLSDKRHKQQQIEQLTYRDTLTGLLNHTALRTELEQKLAHPGHYQHGSLILLDIDHFQSINDSLGHDAGDSLLVQVAQRIKQRCHQNALLARISSDLFAIALHDEAQSALTNAIQIKHHAGELLQLFSTPFELQASQLHISATLGIALYPEQTHDLKELMQFADAALHYAKKGNSRGKYSIYTPQMTKDVRERVKLRNDLRQALLQDDLELHFQPQFSVAERRLVGLEVLLRWFPPFKEAVSPAHFIPIAEETNQICEIGDWVMKKAAAQFAYWLHQKQQIPCIAINISARQFHMPHFIKDIENILLDAEISPTQIKLEITEGVVLEDHLETARRMEKLKATGFLLSIDDFGTGYSSLAYLKDLPADEVKLDRSFIHTLPNNPRDEVMIQSILTLADAFGFKVTAEGVETEEQLAILKRLGCHHFQGFLGSHPLPSTQLEAFLRQVQQDQNSN